MSSWEDGFVVYPVYDTTGTSIAEVWPWNVHHVEFDEFGGKIKGSMEPLTQFGGQPWVMDARFLWSGYDPGTAAYFTGNQPVYKPSGPGAVYKPQVQTGLNACELKNPPQAPEPQDEFDYSDFVVPDDPEAIQADLIRMRDEENGQISIGFHLDPDAPVAKWRDVTIHGRQWREWANHHSDIMEGIETKTVESTYQDNRLSTGDAYGVYAASSPEIKDLEDEQRYAGQVGPVTHATRYSVTVTGSEKYVIIKVKNNLTGREDVAGMISVQALREGEPQANISIWDRIFNPNKVHRIQARSLHVFGDGHFRSIQTRGCKVDVLSQSL